MKNLVISYSALSEKVYAGYTNPPSKTVPFATWRRKVDVTSQVLQAIVDKVGAGNTLEIGTDGVPKYKITVEEIGGKQ